MMVYSSWVPSGDTTPYLVPAGHYVVRRSSRGLVATHDVFGMGPSLHPTS